ncbi:MAG TPA: epoxyqueuosine reductase QueH [Geobacteraceae bacterium]|nr:epoxyqueuosine reductase QueH [Geobacteraceae bacterium]
MKILMHICCAPCAIYPVSELRAGGKLVTGFFFNHNIHPYLEYRRRLDTVVDYAQKESLEIIVDEEYRLEEFLAVVARKPDDRCGYCYRARLERTAEEAAVKGFDSFSSSLLYSRFQNHDMIRSLGEQAGEKFGVPFHYDDFRRGWQDGIRMSKESGMYRQQYCGCIYSEKDRYAPKASTRSR